VFRFADSIETHGLDCGPYETLYEEFMICRGCDGRFDPEEWSAAEPNMDLDSGFPDETKIQMTFDGESRPASSA
jgi:hypothetical protein